MNHDIEARLDVDKKDERKGYHRGVTIAKIPRMKGGTRTRAINIENYLINYGFFRWRK